MAQMALHPSIENEEEVRSWVQDPLVACFCNSYKSKKKKNNFIYIYIYVYIYHFLDSVLPRAILSLYARPRFQILTLE